jgi:hypothetical protein
MAFKLPPHGTSAAARSGSEAAISELDAVQAICADIERTARSRKEGEQQPSLVEEKGIISVADARKRASYLEHLVFDIKKLVWA